MSGSDIDTARLKELIELMNRHQLEELEIEHEGYKVRIRKRGEKVKEVVTVPTSSPGSPGPASMPVGGAQSPVDESRVIRSPMVGTFYRATNPDADPFVDEGDRIDEGKVLCIIEAMKVMNEIKAEVSGVIDSILVANGEPVEFGQPLIRLVE